MTVQPIHTGLIPIAEQTLFRLLDQHLPALEERTVPAITSKLAAAVMVMGEGNEQMPLAVLTDLPFVTFQKRDPSAAEPAALRMKPEDDFLRFWPDRSLLRRRDGQPAYVLLDYELLERTRESDSATQP